MAKVKPIPDGYPRVAPYMIIDGAKDAIDFYVDVLGATNRGAMLDPDGKVGHAELEIGGSVIMIADEAPTMDAHAPKKFGGSPISLHVYVEDVDAVFAKAVEKGATSVHGVEDRFYGDRSGTFDDPWGHRWSVASHVEDVPPEEMEERARKAMAEGGG